MNQPSLSFKDKLTKSGPRKLLALDGGGIRGVITLGVLAEMEGQLKEKLGRGDDFVLADYFDYIAGTSTGAIIASCLALGMSVAQIRKFYVDSGGDMFRPAGFLRKLRYKFQHKPLARKLKKVFGKDTTLGSTKLRTLLMLVLRNAT